MPELRWILLAVGVLLIAAIWWWESRRRHRATDEEPLGSDSEAASRSQPTLAVTTQDREERDEENLPPIRASRRERSPVADDLPVVEIPENAEPELAQPSLAEEEPVGVPYRAMQRREALGDLPPELRSLPTDGRADAEQREPWVRTQPLDRDRVMDRGEGVPENSPARDSSGEGELPTIEPEPGGAERQKIIALRLVAPHERWPGELVRRSLEAEGLRFGKYSVFHRERDDGRSIFYVANMIEPGSFELDSMDSASFPGISIFAVLPGPVDAGTTFDVMLATARRLADRLSGHLQDEQGSTLTAQRVLNLREELVHFEHLNWRLRSS